MIPCPYILLCAEIFPLTLIATFTIRAGIHHKSRICFQTIKVLVPAYLWLPQIPSLRSACRQVGQKEGGGTDLAVEDHAGAWPSEGLVGGGCDNIAVRERLVSLLCSHQATAAAQVSCQQMRADVAKMKKSLNTRAGRSDLLRCRIPV